MSLISVMKAVNTRLNHSVAILYHTLLSAPKFITDENKMRIQDEFLFPVESA